MIIKTVLEIPVELRVNTTRGDGPEIVSCVLDPDECSDVTAKPPSAKLATQILGDADLRDFVDKQRPFGEVLKEIQQAFAEADAEERAEWRDVPRLHNGDVDCVVDRDWDCCGCPGYELDPYGEKSCEDVMRHYQMRWVDGRPEFRRKDGER